MTGEQIIQVPLRAIRPHPRNVEFFDEADTESFARLKASIAEVGMLTPIRVSKDYTIVSGHQRYRACKELGVEMVNVIVDSELEDENDKLMQLIASNFGRIKNDPIKQGKMIAEYEQLCGIAKGRPRGGKNGNNSRISQEELAKELGCDVTTLRNLKRLANLSPEVQEVVRSGQISPTSAVKVLAGLSVDEQIKIINALPQAKDRVTQAEVRDLRNRLCTAESDRDKAQAAAVKADDDAQNLRQQVKSMDSQLVETRTALTEAQQQLSAKPTEVRVEVEVPPADYAALQEAANRASELEVTVKDLQNQLAEAHIAHPTVDDPVPEEAPAPVKPRTPMDTAQAVWEGAKTLLDLLQPLLNADYRDKLPIRTQTSLKERLYDLEDDVHKVMKALRVPQMESPAYRY